MSRQTIRVLFVDCQDARPPDVLESLPRSPHFHIDAAAGLAEARRYLEQTQGGYDVVVLAEGSPPKPPGSAEGPAIQLITEVKSLYPHLECILCAAQKGEAERNALRAGAYYCLAQPCDPETLIFLIERVTEYQRLKAQRNFVQLEKLNQLYTRISAAQNLDDSLQTALREGLQLVGTDEGSIMLENPITNELEIKTWIVGNEVIADKPDRKFARGEGIAGHVAATGQAYNCQDTDQETRFVAAVTGRPLRSILAAPIVSHGHVLGVINADSLEPYFFSENDRQILTALAGHLAVVIKSQMLRDIGRELSTLQSNKMLAKIVESACILMGAESSVITLIDEKSNEPTQVARFPRPKEDQYQPRRKGLTRQVVDSGEPLIIPNAQHDSRVKKTTKNRGVQSVVGVPLKARTEKNDPPGLRTMGTLFVNLRRTGEFGDHDLELLTSLAGQAAVAIENARQMETLERLMTSAIDGIVAINEAGRVIRFNQQAEKMLGYTAAELKGKAVTALYNHPAEARRIKQLLVAGEDGKITDVDTVVRHKTGERIPIQLSAALLFDYQGQQAGSVGFFRDQRAMESAQRWIRYLNGLLAAGQAINSPLDLSSVLDAITTQAVEALDDVDTVVLYLYDHDRDRFQVPPFTKGITQPSFLIQPVEPNTLAYRLMHIGEPYFTGRAMTDPLTAGQFVRQERIVALAATPLKVGDKAVGVMYFNYRQPHTFTDEEQQVIDILAIQAAIAIENAQLYEQAKRRAAALKALYEAGRAVTDSRGFEETLSALAEQARKLTGAARSSHLGLINEGKLEIKAAHPQADFIRIQQTIREIDLTQSDPIGIMSRAVQTGQSQLVSDVTQDPDYIAYDPQTRSELAVPIRVDEEVIGVIDVEDAKYNGFDEEDRQALEALAAQAAVAIDKEKVLETVKRRAAMLESLHHISLQVTSQHQTAELVKSIVRQAKSLLQAQGSGLYLLDEGGKQARLVAATDESYEDILVDIETDSVVGRVIKTNRPFFVADYRHWANRLRRYDPYRFTAVVGAPISWRDRMWGAITVRDTAEDRVFDQEAQHLLSHLGDLAAVALENTKRLDEILMGGALDAIVIVNENDKVINFNRQAEALFGYKLEEIKRKTVAELFYEAEEAGRVKQLLWDSQEGQITAHNTFAKNKGGEKIPSLFNASLLYDYEGKRAGSVGFFLDRRKIEKAQKRVAQLNQLLEAEQGVTIQQKLTDVLLDIVTHSMAALGDVDAVVLYLYDQEKNTFYLPPTVKGVMKTSLVEAPLKPDSVVHKLLALDEPHFAEDAVADPIMGGHFVIRENIVSSAGVPLKISRKTIGVMFFNYRQTHRFDREEKSIIRIFAKRAAMAIDNNRRYQQEKKRAQILQALYHAGQIVTSTLNLAKILEHIAEQAWSLIGLQGAKAHIASIRLVEDSKIKVAAVHPLAALSERKKAFVGLEVDLKTGREGKIGLMGRAINTGQPQRVGDVRSDPDYLSFHPETRSELVVPIRFNYKTFGVISIQSAEFNAFDEEDERTLVSLAAQAAIAIQNAQTFGEAQRQAIQQTTISPFVTTGPTSAKMFFGRVKEMHILADKTRRGSYALIGGRRIGKSSLLNRLHQVNLPLAGFRSLYHDCATTRTYEEFLKTTLHSWWPEPPGSTPQTFAELLQSPPADRPLVLLFDEADKLIPTDRAAGWPIFNHLRALSNAGQARIILSGERTLREALRDPSSPLFNFAKEMLIGPIEAPAVQQLVTQPIEQMNIALVDKKAIVERIYTFTSGHPNIVQRLCDRLIERMSDRESRRITLSDVDAIIGDRYFQQEDFLRTYWEAATPLEKIISLLMAADENIRTLQMIRQALDRRCSLTPKTPEIDYALQSLVDLRSILRRAETGYEFAVTAFPRVVAKVVTLDDMLEILAEEYEEQRG